VDRADRGRLHDDLTRLADGDREAFHPVYVALLPVVRRFTSRGLAPGDDEDAAQDALVKLFLRASEFDPSRDALSWALGIVAYEIKTSRRRRGRRKEVETDGRTLASESDPAASPEERVIADDLDRAIEAALGQLNATDADTLRAFAAGGRPDGVAPATFRKRVERGLARLRAEWRTIHGPR
jgi:RNA polymerase sigma-70 factor (ECF subfamily)